jgi:3-methylcrotonyl-CoA carboxylase alpha subunit
VEHPVTEFITGVDLVEWQLRVAAGEELPVKDQSMIPCNGHAIECRIYAENPAKGFLPAAGTLRHLRSPNSDALGGGVRVDTGVVQGDKISVFYDPMISKLIVHGRNREEAIQKLLLSLRSYQIVGTPTNLKFVEKCVDHPEFRKGGVNTGFLECFADDVKVSDEAPLPSAIGLCLASLAALLSLEGRIGVVNKQLYSPWSNFSGSWRLGVPFSRKLHFTSYFRSSSNDSSTDVEQSVVCISNKDGSYMISLLGEEKRYHVNGVLYEDGVLDAIVNGKHHKGVTVAKLDEEDGTILHLWAAPGRFLGKESEYNCSVCLPSIKNQKRGTSSGNSGIIKAPMPGKVGTFHIRLLVSFQVEHANSINF